MNNQDENNTSLLPDKDVLRTGWQGLCPKCQQASIYESRFSLDTRDICPNCGLNLADNDSADGPAVFLIFILTTLLVPLALLFDAIFQLPLLITGTIWTAITLLLTLGMLRPIKAYIIALQYKHLPWDQKKKD